MRKDKNELELENSVMNTLKMAATLEVESVSIPAISSGIFGFPKDRCAEIMIDTIEKYVVLAKSNEEYKKLNKVRLTNFDNETYFTFRHEFENRFYRYTAEKNKIEKEKEEKKEMTEEQKKEKVEEKKEDEKEIKKEEK